MNVRRPRPAGPQRGITGLETAIILIAFVIVASVLAFSVLQTGIFSSERGKEAVHAGLTAVRSNLKPVGSLIAFRGKVGSTSTMFKVSLVLENPKDGEPLDLTPPFTANGSGTDPDSSSTSNVVVFSYTDQYQHLPKVPWTMSMLGSADAGNVLDPGEQAEIQVWLLDRATAAAQSASNSAGYMSASAGGITSSGTIVTENTNFTIEMKTPKGATIVWQRTVPSAFNDVMSLK